MSRVQITTLFPWLQIGGDQCRVLNYARARDRKRFDHTLLVLSPPTEEKESVEGPILASFQEYGVQVELMDEKPRSEWTSLPFPFSALRNAGQCLRIVVRLARYFRKNRVDVLDARSANMIILSAVAARLAGVRVIIATEYFLDDWETRIGQLVRPHLFHLIDALVTDSRLRANEFNRYFPNSDGRVFLVPNGIDPPTSTLTPEQARPKLGIPDDPDVRVFAQVSRLVPFKGHSIFLRAAKLILEEMPNAFFIVCGYPSKNLDYLHSLNQEAEQLGIAGRVRIGGYPGPVGDVWSVVDVHIHASLFDSAPIAIHESMSLGLPAVVTSTGGIPELVEHDVTGLVVPPGDVNALSDAALRMFREPETARRLGSAARQRYLSRYRPESMARGLETIMTDILERKLGKRETAAADSR